MSSTGDVCGARVLRRFGCDFSEQDADGRSPLHTAVWSAHSNVVSYLLQDVAVNPNAIDHQVSFLGLGENAFAVDHKIFSCRHLFHFMLHKRIC